MNTGNNNDSTSAKRGDILNVDGRTLRCHANLVDGICYDEHFRWVTTSPTEKRHYGDHTEAMAEALREAGAPLCKHDPTKKMTCDMHFVFSDLATGNLAIMTLFGAGGQDESNWIDVPAGSETEAHIKAALGALPNGAADTAAPKHAPVPEPSKPILH